VSYALSLFVHKVTVGQKRRRREKGGGKSGGSCALLRVSREGRGRREKDGGGEEERGQDKSVCERPLLHSAGKAFEERRTPRGKEKEKKEGKRHRIALFISVVIECFRKGLPGGSKNPGGEKEGGKRKRSKIPPSKP